MTAARAAGVQALPGVSNSGSACGEIENFGQPMLSMTTHIAMTSLKQR